MTGSRASPIAADHRNHPGKRTENSDFWVPWNSHALGVFLKNRLEFKTDLGTADLVAALYPAHLPPLTQTRLYKRQQAQAWARLGQWWPPP